MAIQRSHGVLILLAVLMFSGCKSNPAKYTYTTNPLNQQLFIAAVKLDVEQVKALIKKGANAGARSTYGGSVINMAAGSVTKENEDKAIEVIGLLLENGADINSIYGGSPPAYNAVMEDSPKLLRFLVGKGANVNLGRRYTIDAGNVRELAGSIYYGSDELMQAISDGENDFIENKRKAAEEKRRIAALKAEKEAREKRQREERVRKQQELARQEELARQNQLENERQAAIARANMIFQGEIVNGNRHGKGFCEYLGEVEPCEMNHGVRVDELHKVRTEIARLKAEEDTNRLQREICESKLSGANRSLRKLEKAAEELECYETNDQDNLRGFSQAQSERHFLGDIKYWDRKIHECVEDLDDDIKDWYEDIKDTFKYSKYCRASDEYMTQLEPKIEIAKGFYDYYVSTRDRIIGNSDYAVQAGRARKAAENRAYEAKQRADFQQWQAQLKRNTQAAINQLKASNEKTRKQYAEIQQHKSARQSYSVSNNNSSNPTVRNYNSSNQIPTGKNYKSAGFAKMQQPTLPGSFQTKVLRLQENCKKAGYTWNSGKLSCTAAGITRSKTTGARFGDKNCPAGYTYVNPCPDGRQCAWAGNVCRPDDGKGKPIPPNRGGITTTPAPPKDPGPYLNPDSRPNKGGPSAPGGGSGDRNAPTPGPKGGDSSDEDEPGVRYGDNGRKIHITQSVGYKGSSNVCYTTKEFATGIARDNATNKLHEKCRKEQGRSGADEFEYKRPSCHTCSTGEYKCEVQAYAYCYSY